MESTLSLDSAMSILSQSVAVDRIQQPAAQVDDNQISSAVARLKDEFHGILTKEITLSRKLRLEVPLRSRTNCTADLRRIAMIMNSAGRLHDCVDVYRCVRKPFVNSRLRRLGIKNFTAVDARRIQLKDLDMKIYLWIRAAEVCILTLFKREKRLYEQIFEGIGTATYEECFIATVRDAAIRLFNFADVIINTSRNANKLFNMLNFYNALSNLSSALVVLFPPESARMIPIDTQKQLSQLKEVVLRTLFDFENSLVAEVSTISEPTGTIHRLTRFVMDYVSRILKYKDILGPLIVSNPYTSFRDPVIPDIKFGKQEGRTTSLGFHLILILMVLRFNLERKFKNYEDPSLVSAPDVCQTDSPLFHLFMMNNVHYIVQSIKEDPELKEVVGDGYLNRTRDYV